MKDNTTEYTKSGHHIDYVRSIQAEQNRDAMPSQEEAEADHRQWLASEGCHICGEDDPEQLTEEMSFSHSCDRRQTPPHDPQPVCKDAHPSPRERYLQNMRDRLRSSDAAAVVRYECNWYLLSKMPDIDGVPEGVEQREYAEYAGLSEDIPVECACGAKIADITYREDLFDGGNA